MRRRSHGAGGEVYATARPGVLDSLYETQQRLAAEMNTEDTASMGSMPIVLGTRGSALARVQTEQVQQLLLHAQPQVRVRMHIVQSLGDVAPDRPLESLGAEGIFTHALEQALLSGSVDAAVHSAKDLPGRLAPGLRICAVPSRADPHDVLLTRHGWNLEELPAGATIGTGSPRRRAQLLHVRPDLRFTALRGNVDTRRRAVLEGGLDAVILAAAGLNRLGLLDEHVRMLTLDLCLPQAGQGALALECRAGDSALASVLQAVHDRGAWAQLSAERAVLAGLAAGCQAPVAAFAAAADEDTLIVRGRVADPQGLTLLEAAERGPMEEAEALGSAVAAALRAQGAGELLEAARRARP